MEMEEKKVTVAYTVRRYEDGSIDVVDAGGEVAMSSEEIYKDIEDVAEIIKMKRYENAAFTAVARYFALMNAQAADAE
jgi:hypothetical protein